MKVSPLHVPQYWFQSLIPVVMSGIIAVYGLVMAVLIAGSLNPLEDYSLYKYIPPVSLLTIQRNSTSFVRIVCWLNRSSSRLLHRYSRWSRCTEFPPPTKDLCRSSPYIDFRRGVGVVWINCWIDIKHPSWSCTMLNKTFSQSVLKFLHRKWYSYHHTFSSIWFCWSLDSWECRWTF